MPFRRRLTTALPGLIASMAGGAAPAEAHAFGARYDLPLPLEYYLIAAGATVALSFVMMVLAFDSRAARAKGMWIDLFDLASARWLRHPAAVAAAKTLSVGLFCLVVTAGLFGDQDPIRNFAPTFIWITWWVGFAYVASLLGNFWPTINPWANIHDGVGKLIRLVAPAGVMGRRLPYPKWLGAWPAIVLFILFAWFELIFAGAKTPATLAAAILIYSGLTWAGMAIFGRDVWLARGEAFSLAFNVFGRFAPLGVRDEEGVADGLAPSSGHWGIRPYASDLVTTSPCPLSVTIFILVMLSTVTFDGFKETPFWSDVLRWTALSPFFHPLLRLIHDLGFDYFIVLETAVLVLFPVVFLAVYMLFSWLTRWAAATDRRVTDVAGLFIYSIVPIAIAYHLAHYLSYLLTAGQNIIPLASDPLGRGWNLFGTAGYKTDIGIVGARFVWYCAVIAIVAGHVFAVGVSHFVALRVFEPTRLALRSQYPMLALMVAYTMVSLWILSQPIVGSPSLSTLGARSDTVTLAPYEFRELCLAMKDGDKIAVDFRADRPVDYDIHYHDGFTIRFPVRLKGVTTHGDRFVARSSRPYCLMWFNGGIRQTSLRYRIRGP